ncbi:MAG: aminotransferase class V-fold PLP-dependent enzyme, partial [Burkholderiales bacterium]
SRRSSLVALNAAGRHPMERAEALYARGIESRAGCHCATLAHHQLGLDIPASCRLSFYFYNTLDEVDRAVDALEAVLSGHRVREKIWSWLRSRPTTRLRRGVAAV